MPQRWSPLGAAALLGSGAFVLYLATLSRHPTADSLLRALAIDARDPARLIGWRHPLLDALTWGFVALCERLDWTGGALPPLQTLNAFGGAVCVALVHLLAVRLTGSQSIAAAAAIGCAVSGGSWLLSTEAEFVMLPLAAALLVLERLLALDDPQWERPATPLAMGIAVGTCAALYLTNLSLLPVALLAAWPAAGASGGAAARRMALVIGGVLAPLATAVLLVGGGTFTPMRWIVALDAFARRQGYGHLTWSDLPHGGYAFLRTLVLYPGLGMNDSTRALLAAASAPERVRFIAYGLATAMLAALPAVVALVGWRAVRAGSGRAFELLLVWAAANAAFAIIWVAGDMSFWMPVLVAWWLALAIVLAPEEGNAGAEQLRPRRGVWLVAGTAVLLLAVNGVGFIAPRHDLRTNRQHAVATGVAARTTPDDVIVTHADDLLALHLRYFAQRTVIVADDGISDAIDAAVQQARARHARVFVVDVPLQDASRFIRREDVAGSALWEIAG